MHTVNKKHFLGYFALSIYVFASLATPFIKTSPVFADVYSNKLKETCDYYVKGTPNPSVGNPPGQKFKPSPSKQLACQIGFSYGAKEGSLKPEPGFDPCFFNQKYVDNLTLRTACNVGYAAGYTNKGAIKKDKEKTPEQKKKEKQQRDSENAAYAACDKEMKVETSNKNKILAACVEGYLAAKKDDSDKNKEKTCGKKTGIYLTACESGFDLIAKNPKDDKEKDSVTDCDTKLTNPLSWVLCPLIDLGANTTDFIFNQVAKPLLSNIPISTSKDDPIYKAWNGFRFIANIILIGSMLAIVYAQAKGPK